MLRFINKVFYLVFGILFAGAIYNFATHLGKLGIVRDFSWILQTGRWMITHGSIPKTDLYSLTLQDKPWTVYQWLFEVIVAWADQFMGLEGLIRVFIFVAILIYLILPLVFHRQQKNSVFISLVVSSFCLCILVIDLTLRPMLVTSLFLLVQYWLLVSFKQGKISQLKMLLVLFCMYCLWANMHMGVTLGFLSLSASFVGDWLDGLALPKPKEQSQSFFTKQSYLLFVLVSFGASLINPYGWKIYTYLAHINSQTYTNKVISELASPDFHWVPFQIFLILFAVFIALAFLSNSKKPIMNGSQFLHLFVFSLLTFVTSRIVVWACLFYILILPSVLQ